MQGSSDRLALVLSGGGARAAYQVGVLSAVAEKYPALRIPIVTGVSAGAINASYLAAHTGGFQEAVAGLQTEWGSPVGETAADCGLVSSAHAAPIVRLSRMNPINR